MTKKLEAFRRNVIITALVAAFMVLVANSAIWVNRYFMDTDNFTQVAVTSLTSESSTDALATEVVDKALADYPAVKNVVESTAVNFISGLLDSDRMRQALTQVVSRLQIFLTSPQREAVVINLEGAKDVVNRLIQLSGREGQTSFEPNKIPSEIVVFDPANYPNFYHYGVVLMWLSPLMALGAVALLAWPYIKDRSRYREVMIIQGSAVALAGLLALLIGPLFRPVVLGNVASPNLRTVVSNLYDAFIATFNSQTMFVIVAGMLAIAIAVGITVAQHYRTKK